MSRWMTTVLSMCMCLILTSLSSVQTINAMSDGAYTVSVGYSYKNPETNEIEDGGSSSNAALGESMIASMLEQKALVEQVNGKTYVTIGLGLMSNVSSVKIMTQSKKGGSYKQASITKTGSSKANGDTCNHYRFQVSTTNAYISPILYITPMGREVQFYIWLNMSSAKSGTGIYKSEMVVSTTPTPKPEATSKPSSTKKPTTSTEAPSKNVATSKPVQESSKETTTAQNESNVTAEPSKDVTIEEESTSIDEETTENELTESSTAEVESGTDEVEEELIEGEMEETMQENVEQEEDSLILNIVAIGVILLTSIGTVFLLWKMKKGKENV